MFLGYKHIGNTQMVDALKSEYQNRTIEQTTCRLDLPPIKIVCLLCNKCIYRHVWDEIHNYKLQQSIKTFKALTCLLFKYLTQKIVRLYKHEPF